MKYSVFHQLKVTSRKSKAFGTENLELLDFKLSTKNSGGIF